MKKTIVLILLLIPMLCFAGALQEKHRSVIAKKNVAAPSGDSCTGALKLSAHFENSDTITSGTPAGCNSNADTTWALTGDGVVYSTTQKSDGSYALYLPSTNEVKNALITTDNVAGEGTITFDLYVATHSAYAHVFYYAADSNNRVFMYLDSSSGDASIQIKNGGDDWNPYLAGSIDVGAGWNSVTIKWSQSSHSGAYAYVAIDTHTASDTAYSASWSGNMTSFYIGNPANAQSHEIYVDNLKVYNEWRD
jgi:hypothetical protein